MSILQNAVTSIELGVDDFKAGDPRRLISSVRNFTAGILLLFKHHLVQVGGGDESIIKQRVIPTLTAGEIKWTGKGKHTIDVQQIQERCEALGITADWARLRKLQEYRNEIEHHHSTLNAEAARGYVAACFVLLRDLIAREMKQDPRLVLGEATWEYLIQQDEVHGVELKACTDRFGALSWPNETARTWIAATGCSRCLSDLIRPKAGTETDAESCDFECAACGNEWTYEQLLEHASATARSAEQHEAARGGTILVGICPDCGQEGYDARTSECAFCGATGPHDCIRCSMEIPIEELLHGESMCSWCKHMTDKDD